MKYIACSGGLATDFKGSQICTSLVETLWIDVTVMVIEYSKGPFVLALVVYDIEEFTSYTFFFKLHFRFRL